MTIPDKSEVLTAINNLRAELDLEPLDAIPSGRPDSPRYCPIAKALSRPDKPASVWITHWRSESEWHKLPSVLITFTSAFDDLRYPELVDGGHPRWLQDHGIPSVW